MVDYINAKLLQSITAPYLWNELLIWQLLWEYMYLNEVYPDQWEEQILPFSFALLIFVFLKIIGSHILDSLQIIVAMNYDNCMLSCRAIMPYFTCLDHLDLALELKYSDTPEPSLANSLIMYLLAFVLQ